ncbi:MAG: sulfite exporter TauE/SafE family protein [Magnetococcales bacterium]|nr:sulfite exporter TauE/SafE family protein [Magnetococcales bacterium]
MPDWMTVSFPISGVQTWVLLPPLVAFVVSFFSSMVGISGAFLLLPFQMSVLHFTTPAVSSTNLVFNLIAIPGGLWRYIQEGRMAWPLTWIIGAGTLPGIGIGYYLRVFHLSDPKPFQLFVGCVLLYPGLRLLGSYRPWNTGPVLRTEPQTTPGNAVIRIRHFSPTRVEYEFRGETIRFRTLGMFLLALVVGVVGGIYGIGGGAIIAPFCVTFFRLPMHTIAGAALGATLLTSMAGVILYSLLPAPPGLPTHPDWALGALFGLGGVGGMYLGARCQKFISQKWLKRLLGLLLTLLAMRYILV